MKNKFYALIVVLAAAVSGCGGEKEQTPASAQPNPLSSEAGSAGAPAYAEGREYVRLPSPIGAAPKDGTMEIVEFFFYKCPHCYRLQKPLNEWVEASGGRVKKIMRPAVFSDRWAPMAKAFHAMEIAGFDESLHQAIFEEIHARGVDLDNETALFALVEKKKGAAYRKAFEKAYASPEVLAKLEEDKALGKKAMLEGTPTVVANGLFSLNSASAQGEDKMVPILKFLQQKAQFGQLK